MEDALRADAAGNLFIVQFVTQPLVEYRQAIQQLGGIVRGYLPSNAHIVEMNEGVRAQMQDCGAPWADVRAVKAWNIWTGDGSFRMAVLDTGVDYLHEDLMGNIWTNPQYDVVPQSKKGQTKH